MYIYTRMHTYTPTPTHIQTHTHFHQPSLIASGCGSLCSAETLSLSDVPAVSVASKDKV